MTNWDLFQAYKVGFRINKPGFSKCSLKSLGGKYFRLSEHIVGIGTTQLCCYTAKTTIGNM